MNPSDDERLLQAMASGACLLDDDGRVVAVNARGARALGVRTAEARGLRVVLREDGPPAPEGGGAERSEALARIVTANPRISTTGASAGQMLTLQGASDVNWVRLDNGNGLALAGGVSFTLKQGNIIQFIYDGVTWRETFRSVPQVL